ncbi:MAG TPA: hypothetical protein VMM13_10170 [Euzebya sp.]|nr:hypothetical protein [Euzebya sp.]
MSRPSTIHLSARRLLLAMLLLLALAATACASDDTDAADTAAGDDAAAETPAADPAADPAAEEEAEEEMTEAATGDVAVDVADNDLGQILVDGDGLTLYGFTNDSDGTSACTGDCAATWPPLIVEEDFTVAEGLDAATFSTTEREDGSLQLVVGDWPLYYFAADGGPGDVNGQGVGGVWFVVDSSGGLVREDAASTSTSSSDGYSY